MLRECGAACGCGPACRYKATQRGLTVPVQLVRQARCGSPHQLVTGLWSAQLGE